MDVDKIYTDEDGKQWLRGEDGGLLKDEFGKNIPPSQTSKTSKTSSGFTVYDSSQGHCPLCGRLSCRQTCFK